MVIEFAIMLALSGQAQTTELAHEEIRNKVERAKSKILGDSQKSRKVMAGLFGLQQKMKKASRERADYENEIMALNSNIQNMSVMAESLKSETDKKKEVIGHRLRTLYKLSGRGFLSVFLGGEAYSDTDRNMRIINSVVENDLELLSTYRDNIDLMTFKKKTIEARIHELEEKRGQAASVEKKLQKQVELNRRVVRSLKRSRAKSIAELSKYREHLSQLSGDEGAILRTLLNPTLIEKKGELPMPAQGVIFSNYGLLNLEGNNIQFRNKGIFISTELESHVVSVFPGDVVYARPFPKKNRLVIVDHGSNYFTVYANLKSASVKVGDSVKAGDVLGKAGFDRFHDVAGVHFEIRYFSDPLDPMKWLDKKKTINISAVEEAGW